MITRKTILFNDSTLSEFQIKKRTWRIIQITMRENKVDSIAFIREQLECELIEARDICEFIANHEWIE